MVHTWTEAAEFVIADEEAFCNLDARLTYSEVTVKDGNGTAGRLALVSINKAEKFSAQFLEQLGIPGLTGPVLLIGGGMAQFRAGVWTRATDPRERATVVSDMVRESLARASDGRARPVGLFVADQDVAAFEAAGSVLPRSRPSHGWCTLDLNGARTMDEFLGQQRRKSRQTWHRDMRDAERLCLAYEVMDLDDATTLAAASLIADVSRRNGQAEHDQLVRWRMAGFQHRPGKSYYIRTSDSRGVVAFTGCRIYGTTLQSHTIGIDPAVSDRRSVYHYAAYLAPLLEALAAGQAQVEFGITHELPKLARGCDSTSLWQVDFGPQ
jgi:hypothetical protein